eukprot:6174665-Pleurochrysis_carterae.AAC.5
MAGFQIVAFTAVLQVQIGRPPSIGSPRMRKRCSTMSIRKQELDFDFGLCSTHNSEASTQSCF